jgi:hypothetical protein
MSWTTPEELVGQVERLWTQGRLLACSPKLQTEGDHTDELLHFPLRLRMRRPSPSDLGAKFESVRAWISALDQGSKGARGFGYELEWEEVNTRQLGRNRLPAGVHVASRDDALALIGKTEAAAEFDALTETTLARLPALHEWIRRRPLIALGHVHDWHRILDCLAWFRDHPRSGLYIRQIDVAGVDSKFIEARKALLSELLDIVLPSVAIEREATGVKGFEARYGLRAKSALVRFRILDDGLATAGLTDLTVPAEQFARLSLGIQRVYVVENEITGLAFPPAAGSIAVLGLGHAVSLLSPATWLGACEIHYWSDIDTHGFAMLDRLRASFPHARSLLMDRETLLAHRPMWSSEDTPIIASLARLTPAEAALYADLRYDRLGRSVRLEQERISFGWLRARIEERIGSADR